MKNPCLMPGPDSATRKSREAMGMTVVQIFTDFLGGRALPNRVV
jgi:hypothetical protein